MRLGRLHLRAGTVAPALLVGLVAGCTSPAGPGVSSGAGGGRIQVVAGENVWGSIAAQLGGDHVAVHSIIANPAADPHSYEPGPGDARLVATAGYVIANGIGYDPWLSKLEAASPARGRIDLDVGAALGMAAGANPHRWYAPADVDRVVDLITQDLKRLQPAASAYFDAQHAAFVSTGLGPYRFLLSQIRSRYGGAPVGASESVFAPLAESLGLDLITPPTFLSAVSEGGEPTAADRATVDSQLRARLVRVYVVNSQNETPDVKAQVDAARSARIPVVSITETLAPADATFEAWQVAQLRTLEAALAGAS